MFHTILVPLDGSPEAEGALPLAASIAHHAGATLRLVHVITDLADRFFWAPMPGSPIEADLRRQSMTEAQDYLAAIAKRLETVGLPSVVCDVVDETVGITESIRSDALRTHADLIVMINHHRGALGRFLYGSIADELVRSLPVPVLLLTPKAPRPDLSPEPNIEHVLVALDGTAQAEQILDAAKELGQAMAAEITLLRVVSEARHPTAAQEEAAHYLDRVAVRLRASGAKVHTRVLVAGQAADALLHEAVTDADVLAVETQGRHGLTRLWHRNVVDRVVKESTHPVLILRPAAGAPVPA
jgi:nucleotide-binding universal stress UspA family protein